MNYQCNACGSWDYTTNEDDMVLGLCIMCQEFGSSHIVERGDKVTDYNCNCEDYPCCGH